MIELLIGSVLTFAIVFFSYLSGHAKGKRDNTQAIEQFAQVVDYDPARDKLIMCTSTNLSEESFAAIDKAYFNDPKHKTYLFDGLDDVRFIVLKGKRVGGEYPHCETPGCTNKRTRVIPTADDDPAERMICDECYEYETNFEVRRY